MAEQRVRLGPRASLAAIDAELAWRSANPNEHDLNGHLRELDGLLDLRLLAQARADLALLEAANTD